MDKTLFELVPVSVKPDKEGWYDLIIDPEGDLKAGSYYFKSDWWWEDENYTADEDFTVDYMFYLRPLPLPVAEGRTLLDSIKEVMGCTCPEIYKSRGMAAPDCAECNYAEDIADHLLKRFHITKK